MSARLIEPGALLAQRYVVEDLLVEEGESDTWRAFDSVLARSVVLQVLPSSSPYAARLLEAAKRAARVTDPRILQVLDAVDDGELTYVVREWATGQALEVVLAEGPQPARRSAWLLRELAEAMTQAHQMGVTHRHLGPDTVVLTKASGVKIIGLGTLAALHDDVGGDPELDDTVALGRLLYACLTARWPGAGSPSLPPAPLENGALLRPRQVRAGVPRALDELCDRILNRPSRYGTPLVTVAEIKDHLTSLLADDKQPGATSVGFAAATSASDWSADHAHPALLHRPDTSPPEEVPGPGGASSSAERRSIGGALIWTAVAVLLLGATLLAYLVGQSGASGQDSPAVPGSPATSVSAAAKPHLLTIAATISFDPYPGSGDEHPELVPLAFDDDPATAWETYSYDGNPALGGLKDGVGLLLDLGRAQAVRSVTVGLQGIGTTLELRAASPTATQAPAESADQYRLLGTATDAGMSATFELKKPARTRFLLVWLTSLPVEDSNSFRGRVSEVKVFG